MTPLTVPAEPRIGKLHQVETGRPRAGPSRGPPTPDAIAADLAAVAVGALPRPLSYLINDTSRSHGRMRVTSAACVIHG